MGRPVFLSENLFNRRIFPDHTLEASSTESGLDVAFIGTGRRQRALNRWAPSSTNAAAYVGVTCNRVRAFDHVAIDRGHNLGGHEVEVRVSSDGWSTYTVAASGTIPSTVLPNSRLSDGVPVRTEEGAILWRVGKHAGAAVRLHVPAMGSGLKPELVGAYAGIGFRPEHAVQKPFGFGKIRLIYQVERSPQAWAAPGEIGRLRAGQMGLKLADRPEYGIVRYHIEELYFARKPMWLVFDDEEAEKSRLVVAPPGEAGFEIRDGDWSHFQGEIPYEEHEPSFIGGVS